MSRIEDLFTAMTHTDVVVVDLYDAGDELPHCHAGFALQIGAAVLADKPLVLVIRPGACVPDRLSAAASYILEGPNTAPDFADRFADMLRVVTEPDR